MGGDNTVDPRHAETAYPDGQHESDRGRLRVRPICPAAIVVAWRRERRPGTARTQRKSGCQARPKVRRLADPAGFLSSTGPLTAVLGSQRATAHRGIGTTENGDDGPC